MKKVIVPIIAGVVIILVVIGISLIPKDRKDQVREVTVKADTSWIAEAESAKENGNFLQAKELYKAAKAEASSVNELTKIQKQIEEINMAIIFSSRKDECSQNYKVKPNDALSKIAKKFNTTVGLLKRANGLKSDTIIPGQKLKVSTCKFLIVVDKSQNILSLIREGETIKTYVVSTGKDSSTPVGNFKIINKLKNPTWYKTGAVISPESPENILGTRWMGFDLKGYGIHGTTQPDKLGIQITLGCVRMKNEEVEELYDIVPSGAEVTIVD